MKVLIGIPNAEKLIGKKLLEKLRSNNIDVICNPTYQRISKEFLIDNIRDADGYIAGCEVLDANVLSEAKNLKIIARYGTGFDGIDIKTATEKNILVTTTKGVNANSVAEHALMLILATTRRLTFYRKSMEQGVWKTGDFYELAGKRIGIIGFGLIGRLVAEKLSALANEIIAYDPNISRNVFAEYGVSYCELNELLRTSDIITLHLPGCKSPIIGEREFSLMKKEAVLINTSRGSLIDSESLYYALINNKIYGAGLDVFDEEPKGSLPFLDLENAVVTPHIAGGSIESHIKSGEMCVNAVMDVLLYKRKPENIVDGVML